MSYQQLLSSILTTRDVVAAPAMSGSERERARSLRLPAAHLELLTTANGISAYAGYFRLFGVSPPTSTSVDISYWNDESTWKFAWPNTVREFLCFGETAFGDQYAYDAGDLTGEGDPQVYFLEGLMMQPEPLAGSFAQFVEKIFFRNCVSPYDSVLVRTRQRLGALAVTDHVIYVPSPMLTDGEDEDSICRMNAVAAMVANGDMATQLGDEPDERQVEAIEPYVDENGRARLRVIWAT